MLLRRTVSARWRRQLVLPVFALLVLRDAVRARVPS
jgi:hypothetical protein